MHNEKNDQLHIATASLKNLLKLFEDDAILENFELGDTNAPFSGFIDESVFRKPVMVAHILKFGYDFKGLVHFSAKIGSFNIRLVPADQAKNQTYLIEGPFKKIIQLKNITIEQSAYDPGKYKIT